MQLKTKKILLLFSVLVIFLFLLEILSLLFFQVSNDFWQYDNDTGYTLIPNKEGRYISQDFSLDVEINSHGFRDIERDFDNSNHTYKILIIGDSFVEAMQVPLENSFSYILENKLKALGNYEVIPLGVSGYGTLQELLMLEKYGKKYNPDLIILMFFPVNDPYDNSFYLEQDTKVPFYVNNTIIYPKEPGKFKKFFKFIYGKSNLFRNVVISYRKILSGSDVVNNSRLYSPYYEVYLENYNEKWEDAWHTTELLLANFSDANSKLILFIPPSKEQVYGFDKQEYYDYGLDLDKPTGKTLDICKNLDLTCYDLKEAFLLYNLSNDTYYPHDRHWNILGNEIAANYMYEKLINDNLLT